MRQDAFVRRQLDARIANETLKLKLHPPQDGWLRTVRRALGMTLSDVAKRVRMTEAAVRKAERNEVTGAITLRQGRRIAKALGCDLAYALVPIDSLQRRFEERVRQRAARDALRTARTMSLERQDVDRAVIARLEEDLRHRYLEKPPRDLWNG